MLVDQHPLNKSIMLSVLGAPNVGKSSMINYLLGTELSIVTNKPQTTRNRFHCIFTVDRTEIVLVDTPGLHLSGQELNKRINEQALDGIDGADINLLLVDLSQNSVLQQISDFKKIVTKELGRTWILFTKADLIPDVDSLPLEDVFNTAKELIPTIEKYFVISAKKETNMNVLIGDICDQAELGPHHYPKGEVSNKNERFFVTEYIREQAFELLNDELPYEVAVIIDEFKDMKDEAGKTKIASHISASILVNRPSQRGIVVGAGGRVIKEIGIRARRKIEAMVGGQIHLNLHVKVSPRWFKNNFVLEEIGLPRATNSARVWKK